MAPVLWTFVLREISAEAEREPQQLQNYWSEVRYTVRCIYRQAGTPLADDQDQSLVPDKEGVKELVDRCVLPRRGPPPPAAHPGSPLLGGTPLSGLGELVAQARPRARGRPAADGLGELSDSHSDGRLITCVMKANGRTCLLP